jgi:hypothetical protein
MARKSKQSQVTINPSVVDEDALSAQADESLEDEGTEETTEEPQPRRQRVSLGVAKAANFALAANPSALARAAILKPAKGENPKRVRVYGYDNGADGGRVPKDAQVALVPGTTGLPKGVTAGQWARLQELAGHTVRGLYDNGVTSRTVRRAYRSGFIRFVGAAE